MLFTSLLYMVLCLVWSHMTRHGMFWAKQDDSLPTLLFPRSYFSYHLLQQNLSAVSFSCFNLIDSQLMIRISTIEKINKLNTDVAATFFPFYILSWHDRIKKESCTPSWTNWIKNNQHLHVVGSSLIDSLFT